MELTTVYNQIGALFLLIALGYILSKAQVIKKETVDNLTSFIVKVAMPAIIIDGMMMERTTEKIKSSIVILILSFVIYFFTFVMTKVASKLLRFQGPEKGVYEFALMFSNVAFMGFPVIKSIFGDEGVFFVAIYNIPFNLLVFTVGIAMIKSADMNTKFDMKILINPGIVACIVGFIIFLSPWTPPVAIKTAFNLVGSTTTPVSMIVIGAMLSSIPVNKMFGNWRVYIICLIRVIIWPLVVFLVLRNIIPTDNIILLGVPVIIVGMPVAANAAMLVQEYGSEPELASQLVFITTLASIVTIPMLSLLFL